MTLYNTQASRNLAKRNEMVKLVIYCDINCYQHCKIFGFNSKWLNYLRNVCVNIDALCAFDHFD